MNTYHKASVFHHSIQAMDKVTEDKKHHTALILWLCMQVNTCLDLAVWMFLSEGLFQNKTGYHPWSCTGCEKRQVQFFSNAQSLGSCPWRIAKVHLGRYLNTSCCAIALRAHADWLQNINKLPNPVQGCQLSFSLLKALLSLHPLDSSKMEKVKFILQAANIYGEGCNSRTPK